MTHPLFDIEVDPDTTMRDMGIKKLKNDPFVKLMTCPTATGHTTFPVDKIENGPDYEKISDDCWTLQINFQKNAFKDGRRFITAQFKSEKECQDWLMELSEWQGK